MDSLFHVDGKPFFSIGGQLNNSTSSDPALTEKAFKTCVGLGLNTVAAPVHWELFEKEEGAYDFAQIDMLMELARRSGLRLVVLWFGTWKNGNSHYVPEWVKLQKERFLWAKANDGAEIRALSPTCEETKKADMRAFCELCGHIARNNADGCVIGIQIENEPGLIGAARDYSPQSTKLFNGTHSCRRRRVHRRGRHMGGDLRLLRRGVFHRVSYRALHRRYRRGRQAGT